MEHIGNEESIVIGFINSIKNFSKTKKLEILHRIEESIVEDSLDSDNVENRGAGSWIEDTNDDLALEKVTILRNFSRQIEDL